MELTTKQVAQKLGLTQNAVSNLAIRGRIVDLHAAKNGRHQRMFDSRAINEFAKTFTKHSRTPVQALPAALPLEEPIQDEAPKSRPVVAGMLSRLSSIEDKLDR